MAGVKKHKSQKVGMRMRRKVAIRKKIDGTPERPRLSVFRSAKHIYAQAIDDTTNTVIAAASDLEDEVSKDLGGKKKKDKAKAVGAAVAKKDKAKAVGSAVAKKLLAKNVTRVVFDRNGFIYHGRVSAVADGARAAGLKF